MGTGLHLEHRLPAEITEFRHQDRGIMLLPAARVRVRTTIMGTVMVAGFCIKEPLLIMSVNYMADFTETTVPQKICTEVRIGCVHAFSFDRVYINS